MPSAYSTLMMETVHTGNHLPGYTVSKPRRLQYKSTLLFLFCMQCNKSKSVSSSTGLYAPPKHVCILADFRFSKSLNTDVNSVPGLLYRVTVGDAADVSEVHAVSNSGLKCVGL
jgi:hypothetical protein